MGFYCHISANAKPRHLWGMQVEGNGRICSETGTERDALFLTLWPLKTDSSALVPSPFKNLHRRTDGRKTHVDACAFRTQVFSTQEEQEEGEEPQRLGV